ncbi:hypothetical protein COF68_06280 [Bacillus toyonensis]|uniref:hypothetical protein n=1 Tax=Bacillus toyonensis TaxID=155322 RepID=UPI000BFE48A6|nr:hypothetical protein [Bacillus toyonensis]PHE64441.1 hypothetical protein COF68_06280 [Bacillus toyonensis]
MYGDNEGILLDRPKINNCSFLTNLSGGIEQRYKRVCKELGIKYHVENKAYDRHGRRIEDPDYVGFFIEQSLENLEKFWKRMNELYGE